MLTVEVIEDAGTAERAAFSDALVQSVNALVARYHDGTSPEGRDHRLVILAHPFHKESPCP